MERSRTPGDEQAERRIAEIAQRRAGGWAVLARGLESPSPPGLAPDDLQHLRGAVGWLGRGRERFLPVLDALEQARGTDLTDSEAATHSSRPPRRELPASDPIRRLAEGMRTMATLCSDESDAWSRGNRDFARRLRREQHELLNAQLASNLRLIGSDHAGLLSPHAELLNFAAELVSVESGTGPGS